MAGKRKAADAPKAAATPKAKAKPTPKPGAKSKAKAKPTPKKTRTESPEPAPSMPEQLPLQPVPDPRLTQFWKKYVTGKRKSSGFGMSSKSKEAPAPPTSSSDQPLVASGVVGSPAAQAAASRNDSGAEPESTAGVVSKDSEAGLQPSMAADAKKELEPHSKLGPSSTDASAPASSASASKAAEDGHVGSDGGDTDADSESMVRELSQVLDARSDDDQTTPPTPPRSRPHTPPGHPLPTLVC